MDDHYARTLSVVALVCLVTAASLMWLFDATDWSTRAHLTIVGAVLEVIGLSLVTMDYWRPSLSRAGRRARARLDEAVDDARARLEQIRGRKSVEVADHVAVSDQTMTEGSAAERGRQPRLQVMMTLYEHESRLSAMESRQATEFQEVWARLESIGGLVDEIIQRDRARYIGWRILGLAVAIGGTTVLSAANLFPS